MKEKLLAILDKHLSRFHFTVKEGKNFFGNGTYLAIQISCREYNIHQVSGQHPQAVSLQLTDELELTPQIYGGMGGQRIYREPNLNDPKEKYLAMKGVNVPFRKPLQTETAVLKAFEKFCIAYKQTLKDNLETLKYKELVNYEELLID